jgi:PAS domain S-box-containing protein
MDSTFDFAAFINSPAAAGENPRPWGDGTNADGPPAADMHRSISETLLDGFAPSGTLGDVDMHSTMSRPQDSYVSSGALNSVFAGLDASAPVQSFSGNAGGLLDEWASRSAGVANGAPFDQAMSYAPPGMSELSNMVQPATLTNDGRPVVPLPADYRARIAAHHSTLLRQWLPTAAEVASASRGAPGRTALGMHSSPTVPLSQSLRATRPTMMTSSTGVSSSKEGSDCSRPSLTIQERRRLSRRQTAATKTTSTSSADSGEQTVNPVVSGRKRVKKTRTTSNAGTVDVHHGNDGTQPPSAVAASPENVSLDESPPSSTSGHVFAGDFGNVLENRRATSNLYSTSGFDLIGALTRIANRPNPRINIGPIDLSCAFTVVDASQVDQPIIYCSDSFVQLTGYERHEVLGRNCRFLQSPGGHVTAGAERVHTDSRAVRHLKKHCLAMKECQTTLINYRKDGSPFINLVTVVPITWGGSGPNGEAPPVLLIGFQVDLVEVPGAIVERKPDGTYHVNYSRAETLASSVDDFSQRDQSAMSFMHGQQYQQHARQQLRPPVPEAPVVTEASRKAMQAQELADIIGNGSSETSQWAQMLLENSHDIIHVLSLKGTFLYVSPSVERILGYKPEELVGKSISEFCHPSDVVPVFRELKDSTSNASIAAAARHSARTEGTVNPLTKGGAGQSGPQVNLMMRMRHKSLGHAWVENVGKLHLEQGKGRKVVISTGRARPVYDLPWENAKRSLDCASTPSFWAKVSMDGLYLSTTGHPSDVLGVGATGSAMSGRHMRRVANPEAFETILASLRGHGVSVVPHEMSDGVGGESISVLSTFYPSTPLAGCQEQPAVFVHTQRLDMSKSDLQSNVRHPLATTRLDAAMSTTSHGAGGEAHETGAVPKSGEPGVGSVFAELSTYRSSSWVFELHQLKNANKRLREEVRQRRRAADHGHHHPATPGGPQRPPLTVHPAHTPSKSALSKTMQRSPSKSMLAKPNNSNSNSSMSSGNETTSSRSSSSMPSSSNGRLGSGDSGDASDETEATSVPSDGSAEQDHVPTLASIKQH